MKFRQLMENELIKKWALYTDKKWTIFVFLALGLISIIVSLLTPPTQAQEVSGANLETPKQTLSADTYIPPGHVLIPIEISNIEGLNSILGRIGGTVDLYLTNQSGLKGKIIGRKIRILRAPLNPDLFAVLIKEDFSDTILEAQGPFFAVIHNPNSKGSEVLKEEKIQPKKNNFTIEYKEDSL